MKRVLVVDDAMANLKSIESALREHYDVVLMCSGQQAIEYLSNHSVDMILLDLVMPDMDGFEAYGEIRQLEGCKEVPVVFLTESLDEKSEIRGYKMGVTDFFRIPLGAESVLNRIDRILRMEELTKNFEQKVEAKAAKIEQFSYGILATLTGMVEGKDEAARGHSIRVAEYCTLLAEAVGWSTGEIQNLRYIAMLHDIGKVALPESVLNKPGELTEMEYDIIKSHTTLGGAVLRDIETIQNVNVGAEFHHERYDGTGYPFGLKAEEIPVEARIISIADAYDAMNSRRVYRDAMGLRIIRQQMIEGRGTQFDPDFLDAFIEVLDSGKLQEVEEKAEWKKIACGEGSILLKEILKHVADAQNEGDRDSLTGLLNRKSGEKKVRQAMQEAPGCLAFIDLDNLKRTNDTMGHAAGDYAIKMVGEVLIEHGKNAVVARIGGDEFVFYMKDTDKNEAIRTIESVMRSFEKKKEQSVYLSVSSLSIGVCGTMPSDGYSEVLKKADKALYHVKQSGKCGYYYYSSTKDNSVQTASVDLKWLVNSIRLQGSYTGSLSVEYREFTKIYDYVKHLGERYGHKMQLLMITLDAVEGQKLDLDDQEHAMTCMERIIQASLRSVDICARYSSKQFLVVLMNAQREEVSVITERIFGNFRNIYNKKDICLSYDVAEAEFPEQGN